MGPHTETHEQNSFFWGKTEIFSVLKRKLLCIETVKFLFPNRNIFRSETEILLYRNSKISVSKQFLSRLNPGIKREKCIAEPGGSIPKRANPRPSGQPNGKALFQNGLYRFGAGVGARPGPPARPQPRGWVPDQADGAPERALALCGPAESNLGRFLFVQRVVFPFQCSSCLC